MSEPDCTDVCEAVESALRRMRFKISNESDHTDILEALDKAEFIKIDEAGIMGLLLRHGELLTCYNCGKKLTEVESKKLSAGARGRFIAKLVLEPGEVNYFECAECSEEVSLNASRENSVNS